MQVQMSPLFFFFFLFLLPPSFYFNSYFPFPPPFICIFIIFFFLSFCFFYLVFLFFFFLFHLIFLLLSFRYYFACSDFTLALCLQQVISEGFLIFLKLLWETSLKGMLTFLFGGLASLGMCFTFDDEKLGKCRWVAGLRRAYLLTT